MAGDNLSKYESSSQTLTVTNLQSLAASTSLIAGWGSANIDNTSALFRDILLGFNFATSGSNRQIGSINIYIIPCMNKTPVYPSVASGTIGTEGALAFASVEARDAIARLLVSIPVNATASAIFAFAGYVTEAIKRLPPNFTIFVTTNCATSTNAALAASLNAVYSTGHAGSYT